MMNDGKFAATTTSDLEILITRTFDAPRANVFEAWTKAEHVRRWWDPTGLPLPICEIDLRQNGEFRWVNDDGPEFTFAGVYHEIIAPERLVFTVRTLPIKSEPVVTLNFIDRSGRTLLEMRIVLESIEDRDALLEMRIDAGTAQTLENLAEYLIESAGRLGIN
jgi:uncharacterized protein YndB with AHSA1/START domain